MGFISAGSLIDIRLEATGGVRANWSRADCEAGYNTCEQILVGLALRKMCSDPNSRRSADMHNMLRLLWTSLGLRKRILPLASVAGAGLCLAATPTICRAQQLDHPSATKSVGATTPPVCAAGMLGEQDISKAKFEEIGLQFILVVILGGALTSVVSYLRDNKVRKDSELSSLRDLIMQVDDLYRSTKQAKRMIGSRLKLSDGGHEIDAVFFAAWMEELSNTQLKLEQIRNAIRTRLDLFDGERKRRILNEIGYSEDYLHEVVQEFETRKVAWADKCCCLSDSCEMLMDFLSESRMSEKLEAYLRIMRDDPSTVERYRAFERTIAFGGKKHKRVSDACMLLVIREMRDIVLERLGRLDAGRLALKSRKSDVSRDRPTSASSPNGETPGKMSENRAGL